MNRRFDLNLLGWLAVFAGGYLLIPAAAALGFSEPVAPFLLSAAVAAAAGGVAIRITRTDDRRIRARDGFLVVSGAWVTVSLFGALPYVLAGVLAPGDAWFEAVSGFTTTGSTVIADVTPIARSLLLWRAMTQWLGGMGIILFTIAVLPLLGIGGMQLFKAEVPGPVADKVRPRLAETARTLWAIYVAFTVAEAVLLRLCGIGWFESVCHALTTLATGGFSTRNASVGGFGSPAAEWVVTLFMLLAGINFVLHYRLVAGRSREVWRDSELRAFLGLVGGGIVVAAITLWEPGRALGELLRTASFQVVSIITTTGYVTADFEGWPHLTQLLLLTLMLIGGMSGSTGGGPKSLRVLLAVRSLRASVHRFIHPHAVVPVKYHGQVVPDAVLSGVWAFMTAYVLIALGATAVVAAHGYDLLTASSAALTAVGNIGPGIGDVGAYDNFAHLPGLAKFALSCCMLLGRLEIFTILVLFSRQFWKH